MTIEKIENGLRINDEDFLFSYDIIEEGYLVHNDIQISVELSGMIKLIDIRDLEIETIEGFIDIFL